MVLLTLLQLAHCEFSQSGWSDHSYLVSSEMTLLSRLVVYIKDK